MAMAVDPAMTEEQSPPTALSHSRAASDAISESSSSAATADSPDQTHPSNSSPNHMGDAEIQSPAALRSEEYRQLFRLPLDEVLIEDFNCACQENILIQGHMYLFLHYICFYSNIFGYETKKTILLCEVTSVKRAKTAGIFPNAIEIIAGGKKHFFGSFLSRDEAFKLINEGWLRNCNGAEAILEQQETTSESSYHSNGLVVIEKDKISECTVDESGMSDRYCHEWDDGIQRILGPEPYPNIEEDIASTSISELDENVEDDARQPVVLADSLSSGKTWTWKEENSESPKIPGYYKMVAESMLPVGVKDFFSIFFSDDSTNFTESFHGRCGDKGFKCTSWFPHDQFGHTRNVEFQHPIKIYFGAKFGSCNEAQKFRVYRNSHLVIETSQEINDVPYGDYFRVEGLWDIQKDSSESNECCYLRVYVNVAFSKKTVFKGKIVQSTLEECREVHGTWINMAHELLEKNNLEKQGYVPIVSVVGNSEVPLERETKTEESLERPHKPTHHTRTQIPDSMDVDHVESHMQGNLFGINSVASVLREPVRRIWTSLNAHSHFPPLLVITFVVIILMQLSILVLLTRPQKQVYVVSPAGYVNALGSGDAERSVEVIRQLEKRLHHLKDEMVTVETHLERMRHEHDLLKAQLKDLGGMGMLR